MLDKAKKACCTLCGDPLRGLVVQLKLDRRTQTFTDEYVPEEHFDGVFPFGRVCAIEARSQHRRLQARR